MLGFTTVSIGIGEGLYNFGSDFKTLTISDKIKYVIGLGPEKSVEIVKELQNSLTIMSKIPRKSSKEIVSVKQAESVINKLFLLETEEFHERIEDLYCVQTMKDFFNSDAFLS